VHRSPQQPNGGSSAAEARLLGSCPAFLDALADARRVAQRDDFHVLLLGENGTGKEDVAQYIHERSSRATKPLVVVNCGAIANQLFESEMFGHERGAFTGAIGAKKGFFEQAGGGILFLDEIGELPLEQQPKLLRAIQHGEVRRVGGETVHRVNVRIIAATNRDLWSAVKAGRFREDLYFRIAEWPLKLPPLRQRGSDIVTLARYTLDAAGFGDKVLSADAELLLSSYRWPGNVRELANAVKRAALRSATDQITAADIGPCLVESVEVGPAKSPPDGFATARALLERQGRFTPAEFRAVMQLPAWKIKRLLKQIETAGFIVCRGSGRGSHYIARH